MIRRVPRPQWLLLAAFIVIAAIDAASWIPYASPRGSAISFLGVAGLLTAIRFPWVAFALTLPATALGMGPFATVFALVFVAIANRRRWALIVGAVIGGAVMAQLWQTYVWVDNAFADSAAWFLRNALFVVAPIAVGLLIRTRAELSERLDDLRRIRHREQVLLEAEVLATERARISREMHDVVSHQVSLIALQAGAMQMKSADPEVRQTAATLRSLAVTTLDELRQMLGILRANGADGSERMPQPGVSDLGALVEASQVETDLRVALPTDLARTTQRAIYRTVQEGLTNARKHAPGQPVEVRARVDGSEISVVVSNPLTSGGPTLDLPSARHGLRGLEERAELLGGSFSAERRGDRFVMTVRLPVLAPSDAPRASRGSDRQTVVL